MIDSELAVDRRAGTSTDDPPRTISLTVAQATVRYLIAQYTVRDGHRTRLIAGMYAIFGHGNTGGLAQAMAEVEPGELFFLEGRNEQSMAHAAAAYARATRRLSTIACATSIGPGALNMITAAAGAQVNRLPVLLLPSDEFMDRRQGTILQGLEHPRSGDTTVNDCFRPIARYFDRITRPEQLLTALPAAMRALTSPEDTGAVVVCLPQDVQAEAFDFPLAFFGQRDWRIDRPLADSESLAAAAAVIQEATKPIIIAGGGVAYSHAEHELRSFAQRHGIPVAETYAGKGVLAEDSWRNLGGIGVEGTTPANTLAMEADLVICAGTRLADFISGAQSTFQNPRVRFVGLNIARSDAVKQGALSVVGDLKASLVQLSNLLGTWSAGHEVRDQSLALAKSWRRTVDQFTAITDGRTMSQPSLIRIINEEAPQGSTVVAAAGTLPGDVLRLWDTSGGTHCHLEFGFSCMGYEIPAGIGVRLARPDNHVFVLVGDGTFLLNPGEIVSAVQHDLKVTFIVSENGGFQSIHRLERELVHEPFANLLEHRDIPTRKLSGTRIGLDLVAVASGLGAAALLAATEADLRQAIHQSLSDPQPYVIVVPTDPTHYFRRTEVWHDVAPAAVANDPRLTQVRAEYERTRELKQRRFM